MDILVTGATGLLGHHLIEALQRRGERIRALVLPGEDATWLAERDIHIYRGDIRDPASLRAPMDGVEGVVHLAGMMGVWRPLRDYYAVNVIGTAHMCREALRVGIRRFVHVSSWRVYGNAVGQPCREDFPLAPLREPYSITKAEGDRLVQRMIAGEHLPAVILRPGTFYGPGDRLHFEQLANRLRSGVSLMIGSGENAVPLVYVGDVVRGLLLALDHERAVGHVYNITSDEQITQRDLLYGVAEAVGARPPRIHVPYDLLYAAACAAERAAQLPGYRGKPLVTRMGVTVFGADNRHSIERARTELGYVPQVSLCEGIRLSAQVYRPRRQTADPVPAVVN